MIEINSVNNELVKETAKLQQKKFRNLENKFILEGYKVIKEAFDSNIKIDKIFVQKGFEGKYSFLGEKLILTTESVLKKISTTDTPPNAVAIAYQRHYTINNVKNLKKFVLLENIKDTGNLGTIIRTSTAFNADAIILYGKESVDLYNPKCVRSAVGNLWKIPVITIQDFETLKKYFSGYNRIATLPKASKLLKNFKTELPVLIMFGSEAEGLSDELIDFSTDSVKIEMKDNVESLNLSISCAVILYKLFL